MGKYIFLGESKGFGNVKLQACQIAELQVDTTQLLAGVPTCPEL